MTRRKSAKQATAPSHSYEEFRCPNPSCSDFGKKLGGNIALYTRYGRNNNRLLICRTCSKTFSEHKNTVLFDCRLPFERVGSVLAALIGGASIRRVSRDSEISKNTPKRYIRLALQEPDTIWPHVQKADPLMTRERYNEYLFHAAERIELRKTRHHEESQSASFR
jgi:hypothetical protein